MTELRADPPTDYRLDQLERRIAVLEQRLAKRDRRERKTLGDDEYVCFLAKYGSSYR